MKFYKADELFIGEVGHTYRNDNRIYFRKEGVAITRQNSLHLECDYFDILSNKEYINFHSKYCGYGNSAIFCPKSFYLYINQIYNDIEFDKTDKKNPTVKMFKKILKYNIVSDKDIKFILLITNKENSEPEHINIENQTTNNTSKQKKKLDLNYSSILTDKKFKNEPAVGRDNEVNELIVSLAQDKKSPILVGPSGCGKTTIVDQLAYKIQKKEVPNFLKNKQIIELDMTSLIAGTKYVGTLEEKINKLINYAIENNAIVFIDEIHTIYGAGTTSKSDNDVAGMIKQAIDRKGLKVIGTTTTEEYDKYFSNDALKRRFEKVLVKEPDKNTLYIIITKVFNDYSINNSIKLLDNMENIIYNLIELTSNDKHKTWNDKVCNPDLVIGIIDRIFADAKIHDQDKLTIENVKYGIESCNRIYESARNEAIKNLNIEKEEMPKIIKLNSFSKK